ncbi:hypothetical protein AVEN_220014-1 [Araneus ventricosus]|uniref:Uncharacterized protein n=1 Tax=Araneus ventricosus TaxID=182803 RepID=A0A4Y2CRM2_ARAVE|nr:hypothetical protein AVEN_220014-1 [Araneus ventricosus]
MPRDSFEGCSLHAWEGMMINDRTPLHMIYGVPVDGRPCRHKYMKSKTIAEWISPPNLQTDKKKIDKEKTNKEKFKTSYTECLELLRKKRCTLLPRPSALHMLERIILAKLIFSIQNCLSRRA